MDHSNHWKHAYKSRCIFFLDLGAAARPDRLHGVQRTGFDLDFFFRARKPVRLCRAFINDGVGDESEYLRTIDCTFQRSV